VLVAGLALVYDGYKQKPVSSIRPLLDRF